MDDAATPYHADPSLKGKLRRRVVRLQARQPAPAGPERPLVSISFDDAPVSAFHAGAEVLEAHGLRGTYFVCAGTAGQTHAVGPLGDRADMKRVHAAGHEIACHSYSHLDCGRATEHATAADLTRNAETLERWGLGRPTTFAYPYGEVGRAGKRAAGRHFTLARAIHPGLVRKGSDLGQAAAVGIEGEDGEAHARAWIEKVKATGGWLILFTHQVGAEPTRYGCSRAALERLAASVVDAGLEVVTVAEGARRMRAAA